MITLTFTKSGREWKAEVFERASGLCESSEHAIGCRGIAEVAHHICFRSQINERWYWIVENGIALAEVCHILAHRTHNVSLGLVRANHAVDVINCVSEYKIQRFRKKAA